MWPGLLGRQSTTPGGLSQAWLGHGNPQAVGLEGLEPMHCMSSAHVSPADLHSTRPRHPTFSQACCAVGVTELLCNGTSAPCAEITELRMLTPCGSGVRTRTPEPPEHACSGVAGGPAASQTCTAAN